MNEKNTTNNITTNVEESGLVITRTFDAPRDLVFKMWTETEHLKHWWGPKGFTFGISKLDLRPGGVFHYSMTSPDGHEMWGKFVYREIVAPEKIVFINSFSDEEGNTVRAPFSPTWPLEILNTITFAEHEGKTVITMRGNPNLRRKRSAKPLRLRTIQLSRDLLEPLPNLTITLQRQFDMSFYQDANLYKGAEQKEIKISFKRAPLFLLIG